MPISSPDHPESESYTEYRMPTHSAIRRRAHALWREAGCPDGDDLAHWFAAEHALRYPHDPDEQRHPVIPPNGPGPLGAGPVPRPARPVDDSVPTAPGPAPRAPRRAISRSTPTQPDPSIT